LALVIGLNTYGDAESDLKSALEKNRDKVKELLKDPKFKEIVKKIDPSKLKDLPKNLPQGLKPPTMDDLIREGKKLKPEQYSDFLKKILKPFQLFKQHQLVKILKTGGNNPSVKRLLNENPKLTDFMARLLRDKLALPQLAKIAAQKEKIYFFLGFVIFTVIFGWILKRRASKLDHGFILSLFHSIKRFVFFMVLRFGVFVFIFAENISPTWKIFKKSFL